MPVLSSFISYIPKRRAKTSKPPFQAPIPIRPVDPPLTPHPYASPEIFDIHDGHVSRDFLPPRPDSVQEIQAPHIPSPRISESPRVNLDIEFRPEGMADWFPPDFLTADPFTMLLEGGSEEADESGNRDWDEELDVGNESGNKGNGFVGGQPKSGKADHAQGEDDESIYSLEYISAEPEAVDTSSFVNLESLEDGSPQQRAQPFPSPSRRHAPTPIKIPSAALHGPKVQIMPSSSASQSHPQSRPDSQISTEPSSSVSGSTLARALFANTFVLSSDTRTSRYRSGMSNLTRQDSATLPRGEHPFLYSPYFRDRKSSWGDTLVSPNSVDAIPPVPQIPAGADISHNPQRAPRRSGPDPRDKPKRPEVVKRSSAPTLPARSKSDPDQLPPPLPQSNDTSSSTTIDLQPSRRISRISEAASSIPSIPEQLGATLATESSNSLIPSPLSGNYSAPDITVEPENPPLPSPNPTPISPGQLSVSEAPSSARDIDNVLDYYQSESSPAIFHNPRPRFSPISEESSSALSPMTPAFQHIERRDSTRSQHSVKIVLSTTPSPSTSGGRVDFSASRKSSDSRLLSISARESGHRSGLLPIGERPRSFQLGPVPTSALSSKPDTAPTLALLASTDAAGANLPPATRNIFNRQRSGSAPSPIKVVRDSKDHNAYNITISPLSGGSLSTTPSTGDSDVVQQTFPETPSAFSPTWSPSAISPSGMARRDSLSDYIGMMPQTPMSATLPGRRSIQPTLAQQVLLTRAATSVRGARHLRQTSMSRPRAATSHPYARPMSLTSPEEFTPAAADPNPSPLHEESTPDAHEEHHVPNDDTLSPTEPPQPIHGSPRSDAAPPSPEREPTRGDLLPASRGPTAGAVNGMVLPTQSHVIGPRASLASTRVKPPSPTSQLIPREPSTPPPQVITTQTSLDLSPTRPLLDQSAVAPSMDNSQVPTPAITSTLLTSAATNQTLSRPSAIQTLPLSTTTPPVVVTPPLALSPSPYSARFETEPDSPSTSFGAPPPYYAIVHDRVHSNTQTPITGTADDYQFSARLSPNSLSPMTTPEASSPSPLASSSSNSRRVRIRPPLPIGPRRPSQPSGSYSLATRDEMRERNGSVSSVASSMTLNGNARRLHSVSSPKFQTPPPKWRGFTMDAAKWTFTSAQLQSIVSRAIRQSAEASSIRLLRLETLDNDIPDEMHRLDMQRMDIKTRYKMLTRRRGVLLGSLSAHLDGSEPEDPMSPMRLVDELTQVSTALDRLAEELHSVDEQIAQLNSLCEVHSASALAMALRKLNASFLKQVADVQALRFQVETLEAERDEAWKQAEAVANDYDHLSEKVETPALDCASRRSSRVMAVRKSSIRVSKAGLRSSIRKSQRSSVSSNGHRTSVSTIPSGALSPGAIPPVPRIPRSRPLDIVTFNLPTRSSTGISTDGPTPTSETRALAKAQEELYDMLGISFTPRRSHSLMGRLSDVESSTELSMGQPPHSRISTGGRPSSLPGSSGLNEVYHAMTADRKAMLATLGMLSD